jgi:ABC-type multidrug transport system fused ATPase/permease subunit
MIITSFATNIIQTNGISALTANIITTIQKKNHTDVLYFFKLFVAIYLLYITVFYIYRSFQNNILTKLRQWVRFKMVKLLMLSNNENYSGSNFSKFDSPINRLSNVCYMAFTDMITYVLPNIIFLVVIGGYLTYIDWKLGIAFLIGNIILFTYIFTQWSDMKMKNDNYEKEINETEFHLLELLHNMDKIVSRGQVNNELGIFNNKQNLTVNSAHTYYSSTNYNLLISNFIILTIVFCVIGYFSMIILVVFGKKVTKTIPLCHEMVRRPAA